ncbi:MAG: DRTGG domain-containing protein [Candidatus Kariarchaeaceae archaeon]
MNFIIGSLEPHVGKTTLCLTIALAAKDSGKKVGYFKPIGRFELDENGVRINDSDAVKAKKLLQMNESPELICPIQLSGDKLEKSKAIELKQRIMEAYQSLSNTYDLLIIDSHEEIYEWSYIGLSLLNLATDLNAKMIILISVADEKSVYDQIYLAKNLLNLYNVSSLGFLFNHVHPEVYDQVSGRISEFATNEELTVLGCIANKPELMAPTVKQLIPFIGAEILSGEEFVDNVVTSYLIGAMEAEEAIRYFRRSTKKAVITGGDRSTLALAALETDTSVLIFTGNIHPTDQILSKANNKKVPCLLVQSDTFSTVRKLTKKRILGEFYGLNDPKIALWKEALREFSSSELLEFIS